MTNGPNKAELKHIIWHLKHYYTHYRVWSSGGWHATTPISAFYFWK